MKVWRVSAIAVYDLEDLFIEASCFDEALAEARKVDRRYCSGQLI